MAALALVCSTPALALPAATRPLRLGLIGCDSDGIGLAIAALAADPRIEIVALADEYAPRVHRARTIFTHRARKGGPHPRVAVPAGRAFTGRHAAHELCALRDVDAVLLAGVVARRPDHLAVAIAAGKHAYLLPPGAVDMSGCRSLLRSADLAGKNGLALGNGLHWRHDAQHLASRMRIRAGELGALHRAEESWRRRAWRRYETGAGAEANWYFEEQLSGGFLVVDCLQSVDLMSWFVGTEPESASGTLARSGKNRGNLASNCTIEYHYRDGMVFTLRASLEPDAPIEREHRIVGEKGAMTLDAVEPQAIASRVISLRHFLAGVSDGARSHDFRALVRSTQTAILGREAARAGGILRLADLG